MPKKDVSNQRFGMLKVIQEFGKNKYRRVLWLCVCDCGNYFLSSSVDLRISKTKSCGCKRRINTTIHGMTNTPEFNIWATIKQRCSNPRHKRYKDYGGRGIVVCDRWKYSFENFYKDMGKRPSDDLTLERIDVNGNYCPNNCCWATNEVQQNNKRNNVFISFEGENKTVAQWARYIGMSVKTLHTKLRRGTPFNEIISKQ